MCMNKNLNIVYVYACIYAHMYECIYVPGYVCSYVYMHECLFLGIYVSMYVWKHVCKYVCSYVWMKKWMYVCMYVPMYVYVSVCRYVRSQCKQQKAYRPSACPAQRPRGEKKVIRLINMCQVCWNRLALLPTSRVYRKIVPNHQKRKE
jgi:hypothetical protein